MASSWPITAMACDVTMDTVGWAGAGAEVDGAGAADGVGPWTGP
ncbi:hypothetical protein [Streptomyces arboris]